MKFVSEKKGLSMKKFLRRYLIILLLSLAFLFTVATNVVAQSNSLVCKTVSPPSKPTTESATFKNATIEFINAERTSLHIERCNTDLLYPVNFSVDSPELKGILEGFSSGDLVNLSYANNNILKSISSESFEIKISLGGLLHSLLATSESYSRSLLKAEAPKDFRTQFPHLTTLII